MLPLALFIAFLLLPVLEIYVIIQVGQLIGGWPTVALLLAESLLGAWIVRHEGRRAWRALRESLAEGRLPDRELADAALVLVGGVLLLTPGFVTDVAGFLFVLPFTRPLLRRLLARYAAHRMAVARRGQGGAGGPLGADGADGGPYSGAGPRVVRGEVVREEEQQSDLR